MSTLRPFSALLRSVMTNLPTGKNNLPLPVLGPNYEAKNIREGMTRFFNWLDEQVKALSQEKPDHKSIQEALPYSLETTDDQQGGLASLLAQPVVEQGGRAKDIVERSLGINLNTDGIKSAEQQWTTQEANIATEIIANLLIKANESKDNYIRELATTHALKYQDPNQGPLTEILINILANTKNPKSRQKIVDLLMKSPKEDIGTFVFNTVSMQLQGSAQAAKAFHAIASGMAIRSLDELVLTANGFYGLNHSQFKLMAQHALNLLIESGGKQGQTKLIELARTCKSNQLATMAINAANILPIEEAYDFLIRILEEPTDNVGRDLKHIATTRLSALASENDITPDFFRIAKILNQADSITQDCINSYLVSKVQEEDLEKLEAIIAGKSDRLTMQECIATLKVFKESSIPLIFRSLIKYNLVDQEHPYIPILENIMGTNFGAKSLDELQLQLAHKLIHQPEETLASHLGSLVTISRRFLGDRESLLNDYTSRLFLSNSHNHPHLLSYLSIDPDARFLSLKKAILEESINAAADKEPEKYRQINELSNTIAAQYSELQD